MLKAVEGRRSILKAVGARKVVTIAFVDVEVGE